MKLSDLSAKSRATIGKIAKAKGFKPCEILTYINAISSRREVSKHLPAKTLFFPEGV